MTSLNATSDVFIKLTSKVRSTWRFEERTKQTVQKFSWQRQDLSDYLPLMTTRQRVQRTTFHTELLHFECVQSCDYNSVWVYEEHIIVGPIISSAWTFKCKLGFDPPKLKCKDPLLSLFNFNHFFSSSRIWTSKTAMSVRTRNEEWKNTGQCYYCYYNL